VHHTATQATQEIASLGQQPNRVQATTHPTTRPIAASVAGTTPAPQADDGSLASTTPGPPPVVTRKKPSAAHPATASSVPTTPHTVVDDSEPEDLPAHTAEPTSAGPRSLVRTLGLKIGRIVIDAGHGGHDSGTTGPGGIEEKEVVLDVALRLGKLLKQRLGADVIYTRDNDTFIPLETRTAIANKAQADLFLSIHANSSPDSSARGVETYYLNFTTSPDALEVAARENAVSDESIHELSDLVKKITLKDKIDESREFAADVQKSLYTDLEEGNPGLRDRGVKKAPFVVLIGANMPSILAEISFLTNSDDARELRQPAYRQRIAESLYRGVAHYISGLSGVRLAQN
jgi:N-acetylmuramoyl-L-alanine amidase